MSTFVNYISGLPEIQSSTVEDISGKSEAQSSIVEDISGKSEVQSSTVEDISGKSEIKSTIGNLYFINTDIRNPFYGDSFKNLDKSFAFFDKKIIFARVK